MTQVYLKNTVSVMRKGEIAFKLNKEAIIVIDGYEYPLKLLKYKKFLGK